MTNATPALVAAFVSNAHGRTASPRPLRDPVAA